MTDFEQFEGQDYINQTQEYEQQPQEDEVDLAKQPAHTVQKKTPLGIINKPIQKQKSIIVPIQVKKNPIPPQFLKRVAQNNLKQQQNPKPVLKAVRATPLKSKNKRQWLASFKVTQITSLVELKQSQSATKRFKISFSYIDSQSRKSHNATLRFGKRSAHYVVDGTVDHNQALLKQAQIRKAADPFQPNYWCLWLLNNPQCSTLQESLQYFRKQNSIY